MITNGYTIGPYVNLYGANLYGADLTTCKGIITFTGERHLLIYFKHKEDYFFKIGCITKTAKEWGEKFESVGKEHGYGENTKLYGDVIKLLSQYDLIEKGE